MLKERHAPFERKVSSFSLGKHRTLVRSPPVSIQYIDSSSISFVQNEIVDLILG